jgi:hypothetical protein
MSTVACARVEAVVIKLLEGRGGQRCLADAECGGRSYQTVDGRGGQRCLAETRCRCR